MSTGLAGGRECEGGVRAIDIDANMSLFNMIPEMKREVVLLAVYKSVLGACEPRSQSVSTDD